VASAPRPAFRALDGANDRDLPGRYRAAMGAGDHATAWLIADRLVRMAPVTDPTPLVMRASSFARLGLAEEARADLRHAADRDPFDDLTNAAIVAAGDQRDALNALVRMLDSSTAIPRRWLLDRLVSLGKTMIITCRAEPAGLVVEGLAAAPTSVRLACRGEAGEHALALPIDEPAGAGDDLFSGRASLDWPAGEIALAVSGPPAALIHPATLLRPPQPVGERARRTEGDAARGLMLLVPVYDDYEATRACLQSVLDTWPRDRPLRLVVVDDVTPDPRIAAMLDQLAAAAHVELIRNRVNLGFAGGVNRALARRRPGEDVLLLNADTVVPPHAIARLHDIVLASPGVGTVTPLSNNGEDTSLPVRFTSNALPPPADIARLNDFAWRANGAGSVAMPNGVGFCLMIAAPLLDRLPLLPVEFGRGYYEDVAYGLEARALGFANVCATGIYVGHAGSRSFGDDKRALVRRNLDRLRRRYPGYSAEADAFFASDPLKPAIARLERAWLAEADVAVLLAPAGVDADMVAQRVVPAGMPVVVATFGPTSLVLRGGDGGLPRSVAVAPGDEAGTVSSLASRAQWVFVVDPPYLPPSATPVLPHLSGEATAILSAVPDGRDPAWLGGFSRLLATSRVLAVAWATRGIAAGIVPPAPAAAPLPAGAIQAGCLHVLAGPDEAEGMALASAIARRSGGAADGPAIVLVAARSPPAGMEGVCWPGPIARADYPAWASLAGAAPVLLASRRHGSGDDRLDVWLDADHPVAFFDPGAVLAAPSGRSLRLPVDLDDTAAARLVLDWLGQPDPLERR
jgi:GT2 family glycosyltransferase